MTSLRGLRLLLVGNDPEYFLMHRLGLARALAADGVDLHVAIPFDSADARFKGHEFTLHPLQLSRGSVNPFAEAGTLQQLAKVSRRLRPGLVHHVTIKPVLYGSAVARALGTPCVVNSITGLGYVFSSDETAARLLRSMVRPLMRFGCRRANVTMLFENADDLDLYCTQGMVERPQCRIVPSSGIDPDHFKLHRHGDGPVTIALLGRMLWDKGVREFVDAARAVRRQSPSTRCVLIGGTDPNPQSIPEAVLRDWHAEGVIEYWGWRADVAATLASVDVLCLPSYREGLPRSLLEGGAAGLALIATDVPGCRDAIREGSSGVLVPARDADALAASMLKLATDWQLRATMGAAARKDVEDRFSVASVVAATKEAYRAALDRAA